MRKAMIGWILIAVAGLVVALVVFGTGGGPLALRLAEGGADELPDVLRSVLRESPGGIGWVSVQGNNVRVFHWNVKGRHWALKKSSDAGVTWLETALACPFDGAEAQIDPVMCTNGIEADGRYHLVWSQVSLPGNGSHNLYYTSGADGRKWQPAKHLGRIGSANSFSRVPRPRCTVSGEQIHVLYVRENANLVHRHSVDKGRTWLPETVLARDAKALDIACEGNDLAASWIAAEGEKHVFCSRTSDDAGGTWSPVKRTSLPLAAPPKYGHRYLVVSTILGKTDLHAMIKVRDIEFDPEVITVPGNEPPYTIRDTLYYLKAAKDKETLSTVHHDTKHRPGGRSRPYLLPESWRLNVKRLFKHKGSPYIVEQRDPRRWDYWQSRDDGKTWAKGVFDASSKGRPAPVGPPKQRPPKVVLLK